MIIIDHIEDTGQLLCQSIFLRIAKPIVYFIFMEEIKNSAAIRFILSYLKKHTLSVISGLFVLIAVDSTQLIIPKIIQQTLDTIGNSTYSGNLILQKSLLILGLAVLMVILRFFWRFFIVRPSRQIEEQMRNDMFEKLLSLTSAYFNRTRTGDLMALFINDLNAIRMASGMGLIGLIDAVFMSSMSLCFMLWISPRLTLFTILPLPIIIIIFIKAGPLIQSRFTAVQKGFDVISSHTQESFSGIRVIKGFVQEEMEYKRFYESCNEYVVRNLNLVKVWGLLFPSITMLASASLALLLFFGSREVIGEKLSIGQYVSFFFYINLLVWPMIATGWVFNVMQRGIASSKRVLELLSSKPDIQPALHNEREIDCKGKIEFRNLHFSYSTESKDVLRGINLTIPRGSSLGIIGKPGSGKTTLVSLICHLYPVKNGQLFIDNTEINDIPLEQLRSSISYVPQDSFLFSDTLRENISFSKQSGILDTHIAEVVIKAAIHDDIEKFSDKYETRIGERGITLSGGQKQRIAIARALLSDKNILILDDALSAVDASTDREIRANLFSTVRSKTTIIIAHRISTVKDCDQIIVLSDGTITERGNHGQLLKNDGFYAHLFNLQNIQDI